MPIVTIEEKGCRSCALCVDICPTKVLSKRPADDVAVVTQQDDCIGCTSCVYICPSRSITVTDYVPQRPFHRIEDNRSLISKFLQQSPMLDQLTESDFREGIADVSVRLHALSAAVIEVLGRGAKSAGRAAGVVSATHFPELYEKAGLDHVLEQMRLRFADAFDFKYSIEHGGESIALDFTHCAFRSVVLAQGETLGTATLCTLFHEYFAGLLGVFTQKKYDVRVPTAGERCRVEYSARG